MDTFQIALCSFAAAAHFYIFVLESLFWTQDKTRKIFRMSEAEAKTTKTLAFNQGFYNLFLALAIGAGIYLGEGGKILVDYALASMIAAAIVLLFSKKKMLRGALTQGLVPAIYFVYQYAQAISTN